MHFCDLAIPDPATGLWLDCGNVDYGAGNHAVEHKCSHDWCNWNGHPWSCCVCRAAPNMLACCAGRVLTPGGPYAYQVCNHMRCDDCMILRRKTSPSLSLPFSILSPGPIIGTCAKKLQVRVSVGTDLTKVGNARGIMEARGGHLGPRDREPRWRKILQARSILLVITATGSGLRHLLLALVLPRNKGDGRDVEI